MPVTFKLEVIPVKRNPRTIFERAKKEVIKTLDGPIRRTLEKDMRNTVKNWNTAPKFNGKLTTPLGGRQVWLTILPSGRGSLNWKRVSGGVKGHPIKPVRKTRLVFPPKYTPHTTSGGGTGGPGRYSPPRGSAGMVYAKKVKWPGIKARKFNERIIKKRKKGIQKDLIKSVERGIKYAR